MKLSVQTTIWADRRQVWEALHDVDILAACVPGCLTLAKRSDDVFELSVEVKAGPVSALIEGRVEVTDSLPPSVLSLRAKGRGASFLEVAGGTRIELSPCAAGCRVALDIVLEPSGVLAALGTNLLAGLAQRQIDQFVRTFAATVGRPPRACRRGVDISRPRPPI